MQMFYARFVNAYFILAGESFSEEELNQLQIEANVLAMVCEVYMACVYECNYSPIAFVHITLCFLVFVYVSVCLL